MDYYEPVSEEQKKKEREKAQKLRRSIWWRNKLAQGICYYCEQKFSADQLTMDHKVPIARGGLSKKGNLVVACKACNTKKGALTPAEKLLQK